MSSDIKDSPQTGYVYCMSNPSMPGLLKIGMTERTPDIRLGEANMSNTWIPTPFELELAPVFINPKNISSVDYDDSELELLIDARMI